MLIGIILMFLSACFVIRNINENEEAGKSSSKYLDAVKAQIPGNYSGYQATVKKTGEMPAIESEGYSFIGTIKIPSLSIELPVQSNWSSINAKKSPCRYVGSVYENSLIIAGHNYDRHFGRLKMLNSKDKIIVTDTLGNEFGYEVVSIEIIGAEEVDKMLEGDWDLTVFTCTIGGANRVTVRCKSVQK